MNILHFPFFNFEILDLNPIKISPNFPSQYLIANPFKILLQSLLYFASNIPGLADTADNLIALHPCEEHACKSGNQYSHKCQIEQPLSLLFWTADHHNYYD